jgi:hypothetical protein
MQILNASPYICIMAIDKFPWDAILEVQLHVTCRQTKRVEAHSLLLPLFEIGAFHFLR